MMDAASAAPNPVIFLAAAVCPVVCLVACLVAWLVNRRL